MLPTSGLRPIAALLFALGLSACASSVETVLSPLSDETDDSGGASAADGPVPGLTLGNGDFTPGGVTFGAETGTAVGGRVRELQGDLGRLQDGIGDQNAELQQIRGGTIATAQNYFGLIAAINARLQVGTTPGNPILVQQFSDAQLQLDGLNQQVMQLNGLAVDAASSSATASFLLESVRATYGLTGAVDEDHRNLNILEDEVSRTSVLINRLLTELSEDLTRTNNYLNTERQNLQVLQVAINNGELYGPSLANRAYISAIPQLTSTVRAPDAGSLGPARGDSPLVVIRFTEASVDYERALYQAVSAALDRRPTSVFDVVAVSPDTGNPADRAASANFARTRAEEVLRTLVDFGLPQSQVTLSSRAAAVDVNQVQIYVR